MRPRVPTQRPEAFLGSTFGSNSAMFYRQGTLVLEDGTRLRGVSFGYEESVTGELVFTTGMVGYPESLTDPSYKGQLLVMTYPIVGNYGVPDDGEDEFGLPRFFESDRVQVAALIVADYSHHHSHWNSQRSLSQWLTQQRVPALYGLDTRLLTKKIREKCAPPRESELPRGHRGAGCGRHGSGAGGWAARCPRVPACASHRRALRRRCPPRVCLRARVPCMPAPQGCAEGAHRVRGGGDPRRRGA